MRQTLPVSFHSDLTEDRITKIGNLIITAYHESLEFFNEDKGDDRWTHGCRRYKWACKNIREAIDADGYGYLSLLEDTGNKFIFLIGEVPVKFKCTNPEDPNENVLKQSQSEMQQLSLLEYGDIKHPGQLVWRMAVEDDFDGNPIRLALLGIDESKTTRCYWELPKDKLVPQIVPIHDNKADGVEIAPAKVGLRTNEKEQEKAQA